MYHRDRHHPTLPQEMAVAPVGLEAAVMVPSSPAASAVTTAVLAATIAVGTIDVGLGLIGLVRRRWPLCPRWCHVFSRI
jgi:hypothetical protein